MIGRQTIKTIRAEATNWLKWGFLPCEAKIEDWGCPGCSRPVVVLTYGMLAYDPTTQSQYMGDRYISECWNMREAKRLAAEVERLLNRIYREWQQKQNAGKPAEGACYV